MSWPDFESLAEEYYPGSSKKRPTQPPPPAEAPADDDEPVWASKPRVYRYDGRDYEFFSVGDLATALGKRAVTIRLWESQGYLPMTRRAPSEFAEKRHRIYSRAQIEGILRIAEEEGILGEARPRLERTQFREKALDLFLDLAHQPLSGARCLEGAA